MTKENGNITKESKKLPHRKSPTFISDHATGAALSGPSNDGLFHLTFYSDSISISSETMILDSSKVNDNGIGESIYNLNIEQDDLENFREDKARIALSF